MADAAASPRRNSERRPRSRNPPWTLDETILLVDLYRRAPAATKAHPDVIALSTRLNEMAAITGVKRSATFRNPAGIAMKLRNLAQQDPEFLKTRKAGLRGGGKLDASVWRRYADEPELLAREVERILAGLHAATSAPVQSSKGPPPTFGSVVATREDAETVVYVFQLATALQAIFPDRPIPLGYAVMKIGRSADTGRRRAELSAGFPPGSSLSWSVLVEHRCPGALAAHRLERLLLDEADRRGWSIGGEFVIAPPDGLLACIQLFVQPR